ncbi:MAG: RsiV family protein, partial [Duncaniella sp.]|nr:RsiV family protein [Duncaniella sp.]
FLNYSIKNHQLLTAENVFLPGNEKGILSIISAAAAEQYPQEGVLFDAPIQSYGNFQITENDFIFVYQPYEIAPYSSGIIEITVSAQDLYRFLTADAIKALSL